jgi:hypothetical protein
VVGVVWSTGAVHRVNAASVLSPLSDSTAEDKRRNSRYCEAAGFSFLQGELLN